MMTSRARLKKPQIQCSCGNSSAPLCTLLNLGDSAYKRLNRPHPGKAMKCFTCDCEIIGHLKYCSNCGRDLRPRLQKAAGSTEPRDTWPKSGLPDAIEAVRQARLKSAKGIVMLLWLAAVPIVIGLLFYDKTYAVIAGFISLVISACALSNVSGVGISEYASLPGSSDASGKHRCVYCGNPGVYKHGAYKSNTLWHDCSKCKKTLFTE